MKHFKILVYFEGQDKIISQKEFKKPPKKQKVFKILKRINAPIYSVKNENGNGLSFGYSKLQEWII